MNPLHGPGFPRLTASNHRVTSPASPDYNCIAWAVGDTEHWWQPGVFWPVAAMRTAGNLASLIHAYQTIGFEICADSLVEPGFEKVALFGDRAWYLHAARQLPNGKWTSKLGQDVDIEHDSPDDVAGGVYGSVMQYMRRPRQSAEAANA